MFHIKGLVLSFLLVLITSQLLGCMESRPVYASDLVAPLDAQEEEESEESEAPVAPRSSPRVGPKDDVVVQLEEVVPAEELVVAREEELVQSERLEGVINLNTATAAELELLPGVGVAMSARIIAYRERRPFTRAEQLRRVKGVGPKTYEKMKVHVRVEGETTLRKRR